LDGLAATVSHDSGPENTAVSQPACRYRSFPLTLRREFAAARPGVSMSLAFVFPGQGSQAVGMGAELAEAFSAAREVFEEVDDALGQKLFRLMREGPIEELTLTENAQPALMAVSMAVVLVLERDLGVPMSK